MTALRSLRTRVRRLEHVSGAGRRMETLHGLVLATIRRPLSAEESAKVEYARLACVHAASLGPTVAIPYGLFGGLAQLIQRAGLQ